MQIRFQTDSTWNSKNDLQVTFVYIQKAEMIEIELH